VSAEAPFTNGITAPAVSMPVEAPQQLDYQHEVAIPAVVRGPVTARVDEDEVAFREDEDVASVAEVVVWVPDVVASRSRATAPVTSSPPIRSQSPKPNLPRTHLRRAHIVM